MPRPCVGSQRAKCTPVLWRRRSQPCCLRCWATAEPTTPSLDPARTGPGRGGGWNRALHFRVLSGDTEWPFSNFCRKPSSRTSLSGKHPPLPRAIKGSPQGPAARPSRVLPRPSLASRSSVTSKWHLSCCLSNVPFYVDLVN